MMVIESDAAAYVASASMDTVRTQEPFASAFTVVPVKVQIAGVVFVHVMVPLPAFPLLLTVVVPRGRRLVDPAAAVMVCGAREMVKVTVADPAV